MSVPIVLPIAALSAFVITALWLRLARQRHWLDHPNFRSSHQIPTPKSGGIGFVLGFVVCLLLLLFRDDVSVPAALSFTGGLLLAILGFADDMKSLGIRTRLAVQFAAVLSLLPLLQKLPPLFFGPAFAVESWPLLIVLFIALLWLINLYNFMDGIDALAATEAIFFCLALAVFAGIKGEGTLVTLVLCLAAAVSGFLYFNLPTASVFMGDLGSNFLGFTLGVCGLWAVQVGAVNYWVIVLLLGTFIADSTTTLLGRLLGGAVWYHAHRSHGYQKAALLLKSHGKVVVVNAAINVLWLAPMAMLVQRMPAWGAPLALAGLLPVVAVVLFLRNLRD